MFPLFLIYTSVWSTWDDSRCSFSFWTCSHMKAVMQLTFLWMTPTLKWERKTQRGWTAPCPTVSHSQQLCVILLAIVQLSYTSMRSKPGHGWSETWLHIHLYRHPIQMGMIASNPVETLFFELILFMFLRKTHGLLFILITRASIVILKIDSIKARRKISIQATGDEVEMRFI